MRTVRTGYRDDYRRGGLTIWSDRKRTYVLYLRIPVYRRTGFELQGGKRRYIIFTLFSRIWHTLTA